MNEDYWPFVLAGGLTLVIWAIGFPAMFWLMAHHARRSGLMAAALKLVEENPSAMAALGSPLKPGKFIFSSMLAGGFSLSLGGRGTAASYGHASLWIPIHGPRGKARLRVKFEKINGAWVAYYGKLTMGGNTHQLLSRSRQAI